MVSDNAFDVLQVEYDGKIISEVSTTDTYTVGRADGSDLCITVAEVSNLHLQFHCTAEGWRATDRSSNGTFVNGRAITDEAIIARTELRLANPQTGPEIIVQPKPKSAPPPLSDRTLGEWTEATIVRSNTRGTTRDRSIRSTPPVRSLIVGRGISAQYIIAEDLLVSREHARLDDLADGRFIITDLESVNGTFVNGQLAAPTLPLEDGDEITIGNATLTFTNGKLAALAAEDESFCARNLATPGRLDDIGFTLKRGSFVAVLGTSGAGKSTLLKALTGMEPATSGSVEFDGKDLYTNFRQLRSRVGYVPQDDVLHVDLTVDEVFQYGARVRLPDADADECGRRITKTLVSLRLADYRSQRVNELSGGQRKRVSVGLELLHNPTLLILDEPTSGLDPGNEHSLMEELRALSRVSDGQSGRIIIVVTHSVESLDLCDNVLFLGKEGRSGDEASPLKGGVLSYFGPAKKLPAAFGVRTFAEAFSKLEVDKHPPRVPPPGRAPRQQPAAGTKPTRPPFAQAAKTFTRDLRLFTARYIRLLLADRKALKTIALQAPVIGLLTMLVAGQDNLRSHIPPAEPPSAGNVLMALVLGAIYAGASNAVREVVKEQDLMRREQNFGVSSLAYVASKMLVLSGIALFQAIVLVILTTARQGGPGHGVLLGNGHIELIGVVWLCGMSAVALGLMISAAVDSADKAGSVLPMILLAQFVLAGLVFPLKVVAQQASWLMSARWGFAAAAATVNMGGISACHPQSKLPCDRLWAHATGPFLRNLAMLMFLTVVSLTVAWLKVRRRDPAFALRRGKRS